MKILIVTPIWPPEGRGPAIYTYNLSQRLKVKWQRVTVVTFTLNPVLLEGVEIISISQLGGMISRQWWLAWAVWQNRNCDIIYTQGADVVGAVSVLVAKLLGRPVVLKFVGDFDDEMVRDSGYRIWWLRFVMRLTLALSDKVIVPAGHLKNLLISKYGLRSEKVEIIYNAVE